MEVVGQLVAQKLGASSDLCAGRPRPVHQRPRLGFSTRRSAAQAADRTSACLGGARQSVMDAETAPMAGAKAVGADRVELYTEPYAAAWAPPHRAANWHVLPPLPRPRWMSAWVWNAGHDLNRDNLGIFMAQVPGAQRGVDWPRADCRCIGTGLRRHGAGLPALHRPMNACGQPLSAPAPAGAPSS